MDYIDAFNIIEAFKEELEEAIKDNKHATLDTDGCRELLKALNRVDY